MYRNYFGSSIVTHLLVNEQCKHAVLCYVNVQSVYVCNVDTEMQNRESLKKN